MVATHFPNFQIINIFLFRIAVSVAILVATVRIRELAARVEMHSIHRSV